NPSSSRQGPGSTSPQKLTGTGYQSPDEAMDALVQAVLSLDVAAYRKWHENIPQGLEGFDILVQIEVRGFKGQKSEELAARQMLDFVKNRWRDEKTKRCPVQLQGEDAARIVLVSRLLGDENYQKYEFRKKEGLWYPCGASQGKLSDLRPSPASASQAPFVIP